MSADVKEYRRQVEEAERALADMTRQRDRLQAVVTEAALETYTPDGSEKFVAAFHRALGERDELLRQRYEAKEAMQVAVNVASRLTDMYQRERARVSRVEALAEDFDANGNSRALEDTSAHAWHKAAHLLRAALADRPTDDVRKAREAAVSVADHAGVAGQGSDAGRAGEGK